MRQPMATILRNQRGVALIEFALVFPLLMILILLGLEYSRYLLIHIKVQKTSYTMANIITQYDSAAVTPAAGGEINQDVFFDSPGGQTAALGGQQLIKMLSPYATTSNATMIVTSVRNEVTTYSKKGLVAKWQVCSNGTSGCGQMSMVTQASVPGIAGFSKNAPTSFAAPYNAMLSTMRDGENMIVVEIIYNYTPLYTSLFSGIGSAFPAFNVPGLAAQTITHVAFFSPRDLGSGNGGMDCLPPSATGSPNSYFSYQDCPCTSASYASGCGSLPQ